MEAQNLIGFILPPVVDLVNKFFSNSTVRLFVSMAICVVVGVAVRLGKIHTLEDLVANSAIIWAEAQITYQIYWKNAGSRTVITGK